MPVIPLVPKVAEPGLLQAPRALKAINAIAKHLLSRAALPVSAPRQTSQAQRLRARQGTVAIPTVYAGLDAGPSPGVVVGATLGAVAGFLLLVWLFSTLTKSRNQVEDVEIIRERSPRSRRTRRSEMRSVSRSPRAERVIRQERIIRDSSRAPPGAMPRSSFVVDDGRPERRVDGDDVVEVIEEHSSVGPPRRKSRKSGGYRSVDPDLYAGGNYPQRVV